MFRHLAMAGGAAPTWATTTCRLGSVTASVPAMLFAKLRTGRRLWSSCAVLLAFGASAACDGSTSTTGDGSGDHAGADSAAGSGAAGTAGAAAGTSTAGSGGASSGGSGGGGGAGPKGDTAGHGGVEAGGAPDEAGGANGEWDCVDGPPDLCYCNHTEAPSGTPTCSPGYACCFATETSCECADQETCAVGLGVGAVSVKACPPP
jgi:hypothetical protein